MVKILNHRRAVTGFFCGLVLVGLGIVMFPVPGFAQSVPGAISPGQIEKRFERPPESKQEVAPLIPELDSERSPPTAADVRFILSGLVIEGVTAYDPSVFAPFYENLLAREVSLVDLYEVARKITQKYSEDGFLLSKAMVPAQRPDLGVLRIRVDEGYLENIIFEGEVKGSTALLENYARKITESHPLRAAVLERYILLMNDLPGVFAKRRLVPLGRGDGAYNLIVTITQDTSYGFARIDNRGSRFSGPYQFWLGGGVNSALGLWDNTQARVITVSETEELRFGDLSHSQVIGEEGTRLNLGASFSRSEPGHTLAPDRIRTEGKFASIGIEHPVLRSRSQDLFLGLSFSYLDSERREFGVPNIDDKIRVLRLNMRYGVVDGWGGRNNASVTVSRGLDVFDATHNGDALSSRAGAPHDFTKVVMDVSRYQQLSARWGVLAAVAGQRSATKLFLSEQYGFGGEYIGRAYDPSEISGDDALGGKIEVQWTSPQGGGFLSQHQYFAQYDYGATWFRSSAEDSTLSSLAAGVRFSMKGGYFASLEVAKPLTRPVDAMGLDGNDPRLFFVLSSNF